MASAGRGGLILDSGAVIGWSRGDPAVRRHVREALARGVVVSIPVVVLSETLRGGPRDAPVNRVLKAVGTVPTGPSTGLRAGHLLGRTGGSNVPDALVAAEAVEAAAAAVLTSDHDDLALLLADHPAVHVLPI